MPKGFFSQSDITQKTPVSNLKRCSSCGLYKNCKSPKMTPTGKGRKKILVVGESPGYEEDQKKAHFLCDVGWEMRNLFRQHGIDLDRDCWMTTACRCAVTIDGDYESRTGHKNQPTDAQVEACQSYMRKTIKRLKPNVIFLLGEKAMKSILPQIYKESIGNINRWGNYAIPNKNPNAWVISTIHPSFYLDQKLDLWKKWFESHLKLVIRKAKKKPWKTIPNYKSKIEIITRPSSAAKLINEISSTHKNPIAFDYEGNCLKPETEGAEITSCSICWGSRTIAYPWSGEAIEATSRLLKTPIPKVASNIKFEERWTKYFLGHRVRGWFWDTMQAAHVLDNRPGVTGLKFQAFVNFGQEPYDTHIKPFLQTSKNQRINRINEIEMTDLLLYNGLDSFLELKLARKQIIEIKKRKNEVHKTISK